MFTLENFAWTSGILHFLGYNCFVITVRSFKLCYLLTWKIASYFADSWLVDLQYLQVLLLLCRSIECRGSIKAVWSDCYGFYFYYSQLLKGYLFLYYTSLAYLWFFICTLPPFFFFFKILFALIYYHTNCNNTYLCSLQQKRNIYANLLNVPTEL